MTTTTAPTTTERPPIERTEHPHVFKRADMLGGQPRVGETRFGVRHLYNYYVGGMTPEEIAETFPFLTLAEVFDGLSYAYDHLDEIEELNEQNKLRNVMRDQDVVYVAGRLIDRDRLRPEDVPPGATVYTWETLPPWEDE